MRDLFYTLLAIITLLIIGIITFIGINEANNDQETKSWNSYMTVSDECIVDLPEEYQLITPDSNIKGRYDKDSNILYIWFDNNQPK